MIIKRLLIKLFERMCNETKRTPKASRAEPCSWIFLASYIRICHIEQVRKKREKIHLIRGWI